MLENITSDSETVSSSEFLEFMLPYLMYLMSNVKFCWHELLAYSSKYPVEISFQIKQSARTC